VIRVFSRGLAYQALLIYLSGKNNDKVLDVPSMEQ